MFEEHTSAHEVHNEASRPAVEALDAELKSQIAALNSNPSLNSSDTTSWQTEAELSLLIDTTEVVKAAARMSSCEVELS